MIEWIRGSPGFSNVENVEEFVEEADEKFKTFEVVRLGGFIEDRGRAIKNLLRRGF